MLRNTIAEHHLKHAGSEEECASEGVEDVAVGRWELVVGGDGVADQPGGVFFAIHDASGPERVAPVANLELGG